MASLENSAKTELLLGTVQNEKYKFIYLFGRLVCKTIVVVIALFRVDIPSIGHIIASFF